MWSDHRFWRLETRDEMDLVDRLLERRFGNVVVEISGILDRHDPLDLVYPGNPGEYVDVVREFVVRMQRRDPTSLQDVADAFEESIRLCFDDDLQPVVIAKISESLVSMGLDALRSS